MNVCYRSCITTTRPLLLVIIDKYMRISYTISDCKNELQEEISGKRQVIPPLKNMESGTDEYEDGDMNDENLIVEVCTLS